MLGSTPQFDLTTMLASFLQSLQAAGGFPALSSLLSQGVNLSAGGAVGQVLIGQGLGTPPIFSASGAVSTLSTVNVPGIATTSTDGFLAENLTAATSGTTVQMSPRSRWLGSAWNSTAGASEFDAFFAECLPATVAGTTTATWKLGFQNGTTAATYPLTLTSAGVLGFLAAGQLSWTGRGTIGAAANAQFQFLNAAQNAGFNVDGSVNNTAFFVTTGGADTAVVKANVLNASGTIQNNGILTISGTAPTISSGFGSSPSIVASNGTAAFTINVGTGGSASAGVIGLPTATTGWICCVKNLTAMAANRASNTVQTASTTASVTVQNQTTSTGAAVAWTASDVLQVTAVAY